MTRSYPAGYRHPAPRSAWRGQLLLALVGFGLIALLLTACGNPPDSGTVTNKVYSAPWTSFDMYCAAYNSQGACKLWLTTPVYHPADWSVCLRADAQDTSHDHTGCWSVDERIPILDGLQLQGDVAVIPAPSRNAAVTAVPVTGYPVVRGEVGTNTHLLLGAGPISYDPHSPHAEELLLGVLTVPSGSVGYLSHPEHAYAGIAPGTYELRRQREQADVIRLVQD